MKVLISHLVVSLTKDLEHAELVAAHEQDSNVRMVYISRASTYRARIVKLKAMGGNSVSES